MSRNVSPTQNKSFIHSSLQRILFQNRHVEKDIRNKILTLNHLFKDVLLHLDLNSTTKGSRKTLIDENRGKVPSVTL